MKMVEEGVVLLLVWCAVDAAVLLTESGRLRAIFKGSVPLIAVERHGLAWVNRGDNQIQKPVIIKIVHDGAARRLEAVDAHQVSDVLEAADVEFPTETIESHQVRAGDLVGVLAQGHVGQVQQPANPLVLGKLSKVLLEMPDRETGALGL